MKQMFMYIAALTMIVAYGNILYCAAEHDSIKAMHVDLGNYSKVRYPTMGNAKAALASLYKVVHDDQASPTVRANARLNAGWIHHYDTHEGIRNQALALKFFNEVLHDSAARPEDRARAKLESGRIYAIGADGVPQETLRALELFNAVIRDTLIPPLAQNATASSLLRTQARLSAGLLYYRGYVDVPDYYARALGLFNEIIDDETAPALDRAQARLDVSKIYYAGGHGVQQNYAAAVGLLRAIIDDSAITEEMRIEAKLGVSIIYVNIGMAIEDHAPEDQRDEHILQGFYNGAYRNIIEILRSYYVSPAQAEKARDIRRFLDNHVNYRAPDVLARELSMPEIDLSIPSSTSTHPSYITWAQPAVSIGDDQQREMHREQLLGASSSSSSSLYPSNKRSSPTEDSEDEEQQETGIKKARK